MASSTESKSSQQYVDFDEYINFQIQKARSSIRITDILTAAAGVATLIVGYLLLFSIFDHWVIEGGFSPIARGVMVGCIILISLTWIGFKAVVPYLKKVTGLFAAREIEKSHPEFKSNLLNLIDLHQTGREIPKSIRTSLEKRAALSLSQIDVDHAVDRHLLMRYTYALLTVVVLLCIYILLGPKNISFARAFFPPATEDVATQTEIFDVKPGDADVLIRMPLEIIADLRGEIPDDVQILYTTADRGYVDEPVDMHPDENDPKRFLGSIIGENGRGISQNMTYRIIAGDASSREYRITVLQPPSATVAEIRYEYAPYTELQPRTRPTGHIDAWEGTKVTLAANANMPIKSALIQFSDDQGTSFAAENIPMKISGGTQLQAEWTLSITEGVAPQYYHIHLVNERGDRDPEPLKYNIHIRPDLPPEVVLIDPVRDLQMPANGVVPLLAKAEDPDFQIKSVRLRVAKGQELINRGDPLLFDGLKRSVTLKHDLRLEPLRLQPGEVISFWIEAHDNKKPYANHSSTQRLNIQIIEPASQEQVEDQLEADKQRQQEKTEELQEQSESDEPGNAPSDTESTESTEQQDPQQEQGSDTSETEAPGDSDNQKAGDSEKKTDDSTGADEEKGAGEKSAGEQGDQEEQGGKGEPEKSDPNSPSDDEKVLRKLFDKYREQLDKQKDQQEQPEQDPQQPKSENQPDPETNKNEPAPDDSPDPNDRKDSESQETPGDDKRQPDQNQEQPGDRDPMNQEADKPNDPQDRDPDSQNKADQPSPEGDPQNQNQNQSSDQDRKEGDQQDSESQGGKTPGKESQPGGSDNKPKGSQPPSQNQSTGENSDPSDSSSEPDSKQDAKADPQQDDKPGEKTEKPADDSPDARREKATGDEKGTGRPDDDPPEETPTAKNQIEREKDAEPGKTRPSDKTDPKDPNIQESSDPPRDDNARKQPGDKNEKPAGEKPEHSPEQSDSNKKPSEQKPTEKKPSEQKPSEQKPSEQKPPSNPKENPSPNGPPEEKGETSQGESNENPGDDQGKSESPGESPSEKPKSSSSKGSSPEQSEKPGGENEGGESSDQQDPKGESKPGSENQQESDSQGDVSAEQSQSTESGSGSSTSQSDGASLDPSGSSQATDQSSGGGGARQDSDKAGQAGDGADGAEPDKPGAEGGEAATQPPLTESEPDLEAANKATNIVLEHLERELQRGDIDQEWLDRNGWTEAELKKFSERIRQQLNAPARENSPESAARHLQFKEMIKSINIAPKGGKRRGSSQRDRAAGGVGSRRTNVPPEYRELYEAYTRRLTKRKEKAK